MAYTPDEMKRLETALVAANSNPEYVGELVARFVRQLFGASLSPNPSGSITQATATFQNILEAVARFSPEELRSAMSGAEESLSLGFGDPIIEAAQSGAKVLVAKSARDGYSPARTSDAISAFQRDMRWALGLADQ